ncbi:MAG: Ig-like domain-containing protein [Proteobacteria bacterium]|nr:Ig-like domain-containing protein [Pseudomonadota bacterium]
MNQDSDLFVIGSITGNTGEPNGIATFEVKLKQQPIDDVVIAVSSSDESDGLADLPSLTFTTLNWNSDQTIVVTAVNDDLADGDQNYSIVLGIAASNDSRFSGTNPNDVFLINTDDESAGFIVGAISGSTTESGGEATFTVKLQSEPSADVSIGLTSSKTDEGTVLSPSNLTFTSLDWNDEQTVTVKGVDDSSVDGGQSYDIQTSAATSNDSNYDGLDPADVTVTNLDDDPEVTSTSPSDGSTQITPNQNIEIQFNTPMKGDSITTNTGTNCSTGSIQQLACSLRSWKFSSKCSLC